MSRAAERVSNDLRRGTSPALRVHDAQTALMIDASVAMGVVAVHRTAANALRTPDATVALAGYGATPALIGMGGAERAGERPLVPPLAAGTDPHDAVGAAWLTVEQISKHRALCAWCPGAGAASIAAVPPAGEAWKTLRS